MRNAGGRMKNRPLFKFQNVFCTILLFLSLLCLPYMCSVSRSEDLSIRIDSIRKDHDLMGGVVVVFCKDRILESIPFGTADHARNTPVSDSTAFRIASVSKAVTAIAVMRLWDDGRLDLDADIDTYRKSSRPREAIIRTRTMKTFRRGHTSITAT